MRGKEPDYTRFDYVFLEIYARLWKSLSLSVEPTFLESDDSVELGMYADQLLPKDESFHDAFVLVRDEILRRSPSTFHMAQPTPNRETLETKLVDYIHVTFGDPTGAPISEGHKESIRNFQHRLATPDSAEQIIFDISLGTYATFLDEIFIRAIRESPSAETVLGGLFPSETLYQEFMDTLQTEGWVNKRLEWDENSKAYISPLIHFLANEKILKNESTKAIAQAFEKTFVTGRNAESMRRKLKDSKRSDTVRQKFSFLKGRI